MFIFEIFYYKFKRRNIRMYINLFDDEEFDFNKQTDLSNTNFDADNINAKYLKGEIRIVTEQARYPLPSISSMVKSDKYTLQPDFQRRHRWSIEKKSRLIESFIINVPVPPIFLYEVDFARYEVMDGLQRMTAIHQFYNDEYPLNGLEQWRELNGLKYSELPEKIREGIDRRYLSSIVLLYETAKNKDEAQFMKQLVFERLNSGGEKLEPQETRNALYDGKLNQLCIKLSRNKYFCRMWKIPEPNREEIEEEKINKELIQNTKFKNMDDVELVLRFFALRHIETVTISAYEDYFDEFLKKGNYLNDNILEKYEELFEETISLIYEVFGENAFNLYRVRDGKWIWYDRPTKAVYDPLTRVISQKISIKEKILENKELIKDNLEQFYQNYYDSFKGRNNTPSDIIFRTKLFNDYIDNLLSE
jgi:hypothetical protein